MKHLLRIDRDGDREFRVVQQKRLGLLWRRCASLVFTSALFAYATIHTVGLSVFWTVCTAQPPLGLTLVTKVTADGIECGSQR